MKRLDNSAIIGKMCRGRPLPLVFYGLFMLKKSLAVLLSLPAFAGIVVAEPQSATPGLTARVIPVVALERKK